MTQAVLRAAFSVRQQVYLQLKNQILRGELRTGTKLCEIPLSQRLGVSRTPVREAVQLLAKDGLVRLEAFKGARVSALEASEIDEIYTVRECLEGLAALLAACHRSETDLKIMRSALFKLESARMGAYSEHVQADITFHDAIAKASGNAVLVKSLADLAEPVARVKLLSRESNQSKSTYLAHHQILEAIEVKSPFKAESAARAHVRDLRVFLLQQVMG